MEQGTQIQMPTVGFYILVAWLIVLAFMDRWREP